MESQSFQKLEAMEGEIRKLKEEKQQLSSSTFRTYKRRTKQPIVPETLQEQSTEDDEEDREEEEEIDEEFRTREPAQKRPRKDWELLQNIKQFRNMKIPKFDGTTLETSFWA